MMNISRRNLGRWGVALALNGIATVSPALTNPANGHDYQLINQVMTWAQGNAYCASQGGYLATITSLNEQNFVYSNLCAGKSVCFLGGYQIGKTGSWRWITGEPWTYSHWKPDSGDGDDPVLGMYGVMGSSKSAYPSFWNDVTTNYPGFAICEWNTSKVALTLNKVGEGTVTTQGIDCGSDCTEEYPTNTQVKLTATPANGYQFANWSGDCTSDTVTMDKAKSCTANFTCGSSSPQNLIVNSDFSADNTGFTSYYVHSRTTYYPQGIYCIDKNPINCNPWGANFTDHTTGNGSMFIGNGATQANQVAWQQNVTVVPNTSYTFSGWSASWGNSNPSVLRFLINDVQVGQDFTLPAQNGQWSQFEVDWNSGNNANAIIKIIDVNLAFNGNDFSLDDLSMIANSGNQSCLVSDYTAYSTLLGRTGKRLEGATIHLGDNITLSGNIDHLGHKTTVTDANGDWSISGLLPGKYGIIAMKGKSSCLFSEVEILDNGQYQQRVNYACDLVTYGDNNASFIAIWQSVDGNLQYVDTVSVEDFDAKFQEHRDYEIVDSNGEYFLEGLDEAGMTTSKIEVVKIPK